VRNGARKTSVSRHGYISALHRRGSQGETPFEGRAGVWSRARFRARRGTWTRHAVLLAVWSRGGEGPSLDVLAVHVGRVPYSGRVGSTIRAVICASWPRGAGPGGHKAREMADRRNAERSLLVCQLMFDSAAGPLDRPICSRSLAAMRRCSGRGGGNGRRATSDCLSDG